jgi:hypothetical protein
MMVLSLVAPTNAQAASKYTLTNKTSVKAGVTYKYQLKGVKTSQYVKVTRDVSGETVKYNKKSVTKNTKIKGTGKTLKLYVNYGEKNKNYTGKVTVKIYNKKSNKVVKTIVEKASVKTQSNVAIKSVAVSNTTPLVGDTLKAVVSPKKAAVAAYEWKADNDVVSKATAYTVTSSDLGKKITVTVTDKLGNIKTSEATAAVTDTALEVASVEQTGATTIKAVMNKAITKDDVVTVLKGTEAQKASAVLDATDNKTITITTDDKIVTATYTVKVTPKDKAIKEASKEFKGAAQKLEGLKFGKELALASSSNFYKGYAKLSGVDQWGDEYGAPAGQMTVYASTATKVTGAQKYDATTQTVTVEKDNTSQLPFTLGEKITLTAIYKSGSTVIQQTGEVVVSNASYVADMKFGELTTTKKAYVGKRVTLERFHNGSYYLPVVAKDQYGNTLNADTLEDSLTTSLFVTPAVAQSVYAGFDKFDTLDDGTVVMYVNSKATAMPGKTVINISALGGYTTQATFEVSDNSYIDALTFEVPGSLYTGEKAELNVYGVDQYGETVDLYDLYDSVHSNATTILFDDPNGISHTTTRVTASNGNFSVEKNNKKVKFFYTPQGAADSAVTFTTQTASNKVNTQTITIGAAGAVSKVASIKAGVNKNIAPTNKTYDIESAVVFEDENGNKVDYTSSKFPTYDADAATATAAGKWGVYSDKNCTTAVTVTDGIMSVTGANGADVTYYIGLTTDATAGIDQVKQFTLHIANPEETAAGKFVYKSYRAEIKDGKKLLNNVEDADSATVVVYGTDKDGCEVKLTPQDGTNTVANGKADYTMTVSDGFDQATSVNVIKPAAGNASAANAKEAKTGKVTATVWDAAGKEAATASIEYSNAPAVATSAEWYSTTWYDAKHIVYADATDEVIRATDDQMKITANGFEINDGTYNTRGEVGYNLGILDQYGNNIAVTSTLDGAKQTVADSPAFGAIATGSHTLSVNAGSITKTVTLN